MIGTRALIAFGAGIAMMLLSPALSDDVIPFEGIYLQNRACNGDKNDPDALRVKIGAKEISYAGGLCSIDDKQQTGNKLSVRLTCKFNSGGVVSAHIGFTIKNDKIIDLVQLDGSYTAVLHRCSG